MCTKIYSLQNKIKVIELSNDQNTLKESYLISERETQQQINEKLEKKLIILQNSFQDDDARLYQAREIETQQQHGNEKIEKKQLFCKTHFQMMIIQHQPRNGKLI